MEKFWGLLTARGYVKGNIILEIQGIKFAIEKYVYADLPIADVVRCFGIGELFRPIESLVGTKYSYRKWGKYEREMLTNHKIISTQSDWVRANVGAVTPLAKIVHTSMLLRKEFVQADKWEYVDCVPFQLFSFTSSVISYKGLHILIDALSILKKTYSNIKLVIAGAISTGVRTDGYTKWLIRRIKRLGLTEDIQWIGPLTAKEIVNQLHNANVAIIPSFVESYCMTLEESLFAGTPTVASFSGAMPELATNEESALFFSPGDTVMCARCIERILTDVKLATRLSLNSYNSKRKEDRTLTVKKQLDIYYSSLNNE
jgi:glycosyltransferase involved in cell wall biosynthesis